MKSVEIAAHPLRARGDSVMIRRSLRGGGLMVLQSLQGLPAFIAYFCLATVLVIAFLLITPASRQ
jgi:hypothetical protein